MSKAKLRTKKLNREFLAEPVIKAAFKHVGRHAFQTISKLLSDGLPPKDEAGYALWLSNGSNGKLSVDDAMKIERLALEFETQAKIAMVKLFLDPGFMSHHIDAMVKKNAKNRLRKSQRKALTHVIRDYFDADPSNVTKSPRIALKELVGEGKLIPEKQNGIDGYLVVDKVRDRSEWRFVRKSATSVAFSCTKKEYSNNPSGVTSKI